MDALEKYFQRWDSVTVDYDSADCAQFAAGWAGVTLPGWKSEREAIKTVVRAYGLRRVADCVSAELGEPIDVHNAKRGDVVALDTPPLDTLGICIGREAVFIGDGVLERRPLRKCFRAWRVPACPR